MENIHYKHYWFEYSESGIVFAGEPFIDEITNYRNEKFHVYISDFQFSGKLCYSDGSLSEQQLDIVIKATIRVFKSFEFGIDVSDKTNQIEVWDYNQRFLNLFFTVSKNKLSKLKKISYPFNYNYYSEVISKIDQNDLNSQKQYHVLSFSYLYELLECYEKIMYLLSVVLISSEYSNNYTDKKIDVIPNFNVLPEYNSLCEFPDYLNFKIYDRYYLMYTEMTLEALYKFWERLGFYLFQFFKPVSDKVNEKNLSLIKLITV